MWTVRHADPPLNTEALRDRSGRAWVAEEHSETGLRGHGWLRDRSERAWVAGLRGHGWQRSTLKRSMWMRGRAFFIMNRDENKTQTQFYELV